MRTIKVCIAGITGKVGSSLLRAIQQEKVLEVTGAVSLSRKNAFLRDVNDSYSLRKTQCPVLKK